MRVRDYDSAIQLLYLGGELLLQNGLGASGSDIAINLLEVYNAAHRKPDSTNRARIVQLLGIMDISEPNRTRVIHDAVEWSAKEGQVPYGDPELHHSIGVMLANGKYRPIYFKLIYRGRNRCRRKASAPWNKGISSRPSQTSLRILL